MCKLFPTFKEKTLMDYLTQSIANQKNKVPEKVQKKNVAKIVLTIFKKPK